MSISGGSISSGPLSGGGGYTFIDSEDELSGGDSLIVFTSFLTLYVEDGLCINPRDGDLFGGDSSDLQVPVRRDFVLAERLKRVTKPAIPHLIDLDPKLGRILEAVKQNIHYTEARVGGLMTLLETDATEAEIIAKINEILDRMQT